MNVERFEEWIASIEALEPDRLRMANWVSSRSDCGTVACAAGHLPAIFPKHWTYGLLDFPCEADDESDAADLIPEMFRADPEGLVEDWVAEFFDISTDNADRLLHRPAPESILGDFRTDKEWFLAMARALLASSRARL